MKKGALIFKTPFFHYITLFMAISSFTKAAKSDTQKPKKYPPVKRADFAAPFIILGIPFLSSRVHIILRNQLFFRSEGIRLPGAVFQHRLMQANRCHE